MNLEDQFFYATEGESCATAYFEAGIQVIAFYDFDMEQQVLLPVEVRTWRATHGISQQELCEILSLWKEHPVSKHSIGISSEDVRGIPLGRIYRATDSKIFRDMLLYEDDFLVPTLEEVDEIIAGKLVPDEWRNSRDFRAHARELRALKVYLHSVFDDQSVQPMRAVSDSENVSIITARKIIDSARSHGYLTRRDGSMGGFVTDKARTSALLMIRAYKEVKGER